MMGWPSTRACPKELAIALLTKFSPGGHRDINQRTEHLSWHGASAHATLCSCAICRGQRLQRGPRTPPTAHIPSPTFEETAVCTRTHIAHTDRDTRSSLVSLERDTWSPGPPTANTRLHLVGTGHVGSWWVLVRRRPSMRPPARRSSADSRSMRKHHLLRILSLAGTLGALEAASLLVQLRSQHRTLLCPRLCQVWHASEGDGAAARGSSGCAAYSCPWPSRHLVGRPEAWSCQSSAFGGLPSGSAAAGYARRELVRRIRVYRSSGLCVTHLGAFAHWSGGLERTRGARRVVLAVL